MRTSTAPWRRSPYVCHRLCTHSGKSCRALYTRYTIEDDAHGNPQLGGEHSAVNGIFVHLLYAPVQHHGGGTRSSAISCVHFLGSPVAPCILGVRFRMTFMVIHHLSVNILPSTEFLYTCCMYLNSTMAEGPVRLPQAVYMSWEIP